MPNKGRIDRAVRHWLGDAFLKAALSRHKEVTAGKSAKASWKIADWAASGATPQTGNEKLSDLSAPAAFYPVNLVGK